MMEKRVVIHPVKNVRANSDMVMVDFQDGHRAVFSPYTHGFGYQIEGMREFELLDREETKVCEYNGRLYRVGPAEDEFKLVLLSEGYTQQGVAAYWRSATSHIHNLFWRVDQEGDGRGETNQDFWYVWRVTSEGWMFGLTELEKGKLELVTILEDEEQK